MTKCRIFCCNFQFSYMCLDIYFADRKTIFNGLELRRDFDTFYNNFYLYSLYCDVLWYFL